MFGRMCPNLLSSVENVGKVCKGMSRFPFIYGKCGKNVWEGMSQSPLICGKCGKCLAGYVLISFHHGKCGKYVWEGMSQSPFICGKCRKCLAGYVPISFHHGKCGKMSGRVCPDLLSSVGNVWKGMSQSLSSVGNVGNVWEGTSRSLFINVPLTLGALQTLVLICS